VNRQLNKSKFVWKYNLSACKEHACFPAIIFTPCSLVCMVDVLQENVLVKNLNLSLAFFINSCLSLMDRSFIFQLIKLYCKAVSSWLSPVLYFWDCVL